MFVGIIPAYAGNTPCDTPENSFRRDHPRVCGEHEFVQQGDGRHWGSSPRMRGTQGLQRQDLSRHGIIPAYAGNTLRWRHGSCRCRDHPRVCGEHLTSCVMVVSSMGSSPRMRGTLVVAELLGHESGIIPAYAGNTWSWWCSASIPWDHPRVCGEHLGCLVGRVDGGGIIPAYAGNTSGMRLAHSHWRDHPRVCGEHYDPARPRQAAAGSSPRMRGTP